jgi:hypothetical protein
VSFFQPDSGWFLSGRDQGHLRKDGRLLWGGPDRSLPGKPGEAEKGGGYTAALPPPPPEANAGLFLLGLGREWQEAALQPLREFQGSISTLDPSKVGGHLRAHANSNRPGLQGWATRLDGVGFRCGPSPWKISCWRSALWAPQSHQRRLLPTWIGTTPLGPGPGDA